MRKTAVLFHCPSPAIEVIRAPSPLEWILSHPVVDPRRKHLHVLCALRMPNRRRTTPQAASEPWEGEKKERKGVYKALTMYSSI